MNGIPEVNTLHLFVAIVHSETLNCIPTIRIHWHMFRLVGVLTEGQSAGMFAFILGIRSDNPNMK